MSELTTHEVLVKARNLIADEENWCGTGWGNNGRGCVLHAMLTVVTGDANSYLWQKGCDAEPALEKAERALSDHVGGFIGSFNDTHSHRDVLNVLDATIAATAPTPDLSFLEDVRAEPERVV